MSRDLYLALDSGTSHVRALAFDAHGRLHGVAQRLLETRHPEPGWAEQDAEQLWSSQLLAAREVVATVGGAVRIRAIAIANQRETSVIWNRHTLAPIAPAIVWHCRRTAAAAAALGRAHGEEIRRRTGLTPDAYFSGPKLAWMLDHAPGARDLASRGDLVAGTVDSWLIARLTNGLSHLTDRTNASRTLMYNLSTDAWDADLAAWNRAPLAMLPEVCLSAGEFATTAAEHLGEPLPILAVAGDQQAALFGQHCDAPGPAKATYGTGAFVLTRAIAGQTRPAGLLLTAAADSPAALALEGGVFTAGALIDWMVSELALADDGAGALAAGELGRRQRRRRRAPCAGRDRGAALGFASARDDSRALHWDHPGADRARRPRSDRLPRARDHRGDANPDRRAAGRRRPGKQ